MSLSGLHGTHCKASPSHARCGSPLVGVRCSNISARSQLRHSTPAGTAQQNVRTRFAGTPLRRSRSNGCRCWAGQWLENSAEQDVKLPIERCYEMWEDRERIPQWMPWIKSVKVLPEDERLSKWTLSTHQFGRDWEFNWVSQNMTPIRLQKIHWRSVQGSSGGSLGGSIDIANRGQIRFYRQSATTCTVKLTISYEVPDVLAPFAGALTPIVESILSTDLKRFANLAAQEPLSA